MDLLSTRAPAIAPDALDDVRPEPRETGGVTTRLILDYVERERGRDGVEALLARTGLSGREAQLRDENHWSSFDTKIALLEGAAEVLDDPLAARHVGQAGMDFNVAPALKVSLRALGSLRLLYKNIARTCSKFTTTHRMEALDVGAHHARIAYVDTSGRGYERADCELNVGFLSCAPAVFGLPLARVSHPVCARDGGDRCIYDIRWTRGASRWRTLLSSGLVAAGTLAAALFAEPAVLPQAGAVAAAATAYGSVRELAFRRRRWRSLQEHAEHQAEVAGRLANSLQDLVSELRLEDVLDKIVRHARTAVGGKEFVLLVDEGKEMRCLSSSLLPRESIEALEGWAGTAGAHDDATVLDDLAQVAALRPLAAHRALPLRSLCAAPLLYRGDSLGMLVALANGVAGFLPRDVELLGSYAAQAAIALANARLYEAQEQLASRDPLTGLHNHREFHEAIARELDSCRRTGGAMSVVMLDLDGFKRVNDTGGHAAGDRLLLAAAGALRGCCRGDSDVAFRVGGDEFALLLPRTDAAAAAAVAGRTADAIAGVDGGRVSVSYGVGEWPNDGPTKDSLLATADERLYAMKRAARSAPEERPTGADEDDRQRDRLACASRLSAKLLPLVDEREIAEAAVGELYATFGYNVALITRVGDDGLQRLVAAAGPVASELDGLEQANHEGVSGRVIRTGEPALVHETSADPDFVAGDAAATSESELCVAIRVNGRVWGVLDLEQRHTHAFDADDVVFADLVAAHIGAALDRARLRGELEGTLMTTLAALCDALEHKDAYTAAHADDVADLSEAVALRMGLAGAELRNVRYAALLHDIGKIGIRTEILVKPGKLTEEEFAEMKQHTLIGQRILQPIPFFTEVHRLVRWAHERWDGRGYPDGMAGTTIPLGARIICACDAFHAMTSDRPYRAAMPLAEAVEEMRRNSGTQFDPAVVDALLAEAGRGLPPSLDSVT